MSSSGLAAQGSSRLKICISTSTDKGYDVMGQQDIARVGRRERKTRALGSDAACACGWGQPGALQRDGETISCYECACAMRGQATVEAHHVLGRAVDPVTIGVPGNMHRLLSESQREWPSAIRHNTNRDPLLWLAGAALSLQDQLTLWVSWLAEIASWLTRLGESLRQRHGEQWWDALEVGTPWPSMH